MKTDHDRMIDKILDDYLEKFGKPYPLGCGHSVSEETMLNEIEEAMRTGVPVPEPQYDEDMDY